MYTPGHWQVEREAERQSESDMFGRGRMGSALTGSLNNNDNTEGNTNIMANVFHLAGYSHTHTQHASTQTEHRAPQK